MVFRYYLEFIYITHIGQAAIVGYFSSGGHNAFLFFVMTAKVNLLWYYWGWLLYGDHEAESLHSYMMYTDKLLAKFIVLLVVSLNFTEFVVAGKMCPNTRPNIYLEC